MPVGCVGSLHDRPRQVGVAGEAMAVFATATERPPPAAVHRATRYVQVAAFQCLQPFVGTLLAFLVLGEEPTGAQGVGWGGARLCGDGGGWLALWCSCRCC